jgi:hypothetical protein
MRCRDSLNATVVYTERHTERERKRRGKGKGKEFQSLSLLLCPLKGVVSFLPRLFSERASDRHCENVNRPRLADRENESESESRERREGGKRGEKG